MIQTQKLLSLGKVLKDAFVIARTKKRRFQPRCQNCHFHALEIAASPPADTVYRFKVFLQYSQRHLTTLLSAYVVGLDFHPFQCDPFSWKDPMVFMICGRISPDPKLALCGRTF